MSVVTYCSRLYDGRKLYTVAGSILEHNETVALFMHANPRAKYRKMVVDYSLGTSTSEFFVPEDFQE